MEKDRYLSDREFDYLSKRCLYVEPQQRYIDLDTVPGDGNEFIHKSRLENSLLDFNRSCREDPVEPAEVPKISIARLCKAAFEFAYLANELKTKKEWLKITFPQTVIIPLYNEAETCVFCLGVPISKCMGIYDLAPLSDSDAHLPLLSIVLHLTHVEINKLLKYTLKWFRVIGMDKQIARWLFALIACIEKPLTNWQEKFLMEYFEDLKMRAQVCDGQEYIRVRTLMSLMDNYFVLKTTSEAGEYLNKIARLRS
ncbi:gem-associated protein 2-like [Parasteatoda tepidariorum]